MCSISPGVRFFKKFGPKSKSLFFSSLSAEKRPFNPSIFREKLASSLERCCDIHYLKKLHACIFIQGLETDSFLGSKLLNAYAFFGSLSESRWVFSKIVNSNLSLWNSVLVGYFKSGQFHEVLRVYLDLKKRKIGIQCSAFTFSLKSCVELRSLGFGRAIHVDVLKFGLNENPFVGSSLVGFYSRFRDMADACKVFDEITERDLVAYTSMISGYAWTQECSCEVFTVARQMQCENLSPNRVTLVSLLQAAAQLRFLDHGKSVHAYAIRRGIGCFDEVFETSLVDMYIKCGEPDKASAVFAKTSVKTTTCWNALIAGHVKLGQPSEALNLFALMVRKGHNFDLISLANGILSCADLGLLLVGKSIHGYILRIGLPLDVVAKTALIDMYLKCDRLSNGRAIFDAVKDKDVISFDVMMAGCLQNGHAREAIEAFGTMRRSGLTPNQSTILTVISAFTNLNDARLGSGIHGYVIANGFESNTDICNQVVYFYAKRGDLDSGKQVFDGIEHKDLVSWTSMMMGYENLGHAFDAITLFRTMTEKEPERNPDSVTLTCLLQAFSRLGCLTRVKEIHCRMIRTSIEHETAVKNSLLTTYSKCGNYNIAKDLFEKMGTKRLASWNTMISASGMHGDSVESLRLFDRMKNENVTPDGFTFLSVLSACSHGGLVEDGLSQFRSMRDEYGIEPTHEHYGCVVDLLGRAGRLDEAFEFLQSVPWARDRSGVTALVAACRVHGNREMGEAVGRRLLEMEPRSSSPYGLVSNMLAGGGKWSEAADVRADAKERGLKATCGLSANVR